MKINLFLRRNGDGSQKEEYILEDIYDKVFVSGELLGLGTPDVKIIMTNLDLIIKCIKDLQNRKYVI